jgi:hypothetical protein
MIVWSREWMVLAAALLTADFNVTVVTLDRPVQHNKNFDKGVA